MIQRPRFRPGAPLTQSDMTYTLTLGHTPTFSIAKGGEDITARFHDRLVGLRVESREGGGEADVCTISLDDRDYRIGMPSIGEESTMLTVAMGYADGAVYDMGSFQVYQIGLVYPPKGLTLKGSSVSMNTAVKSPLIIAHNNKTLGEIISSIAQTAGVTASVDPDLASLQIPFLNQSTSSGHLLAVLESRFNAVAKFGDGHLSFTKRGSGLTVSGQPIGTVNLTPEDLAAYNIILSNRDSYSQVKATWQDRETYMKRTEASTVPGSPGSTVPFLLRRVYPSQVEAQAAANSQMSEFNRKQKTGDIVLAKGDPSIRGGQTITVSGTRDGADGTYIVSQAVHNLAKSGGLSTTLSVYDDGSGVNFNAEAMSDTDLDFSAIPPTTLPTVGIGRM